MMDLVFSEMHLQLNLNLNIKGAIVDRKWATQGGSKNNSGSEETTNKMDS